MGKPARLPRTRRYWEDKAAEARAMADAMVTLVNRRIMLRISWSYERLAIIAAEEENKKDAEKNNK